jgi:Rrf2 family protein
VLLLDRRGLLAITAVVDIALNANGRALSARMLAKRHHLSTRYLENTLHSLARNGIINATRGPSGGYRLAREQHQISAYDILRIAATTVAGTDPSGVPWRQALMKAENSFTAALDRISVQDLVQSAQRLLHSEQKGEEVQSRPQRHSD